jgi:hypothetical protein
MWRWVRRIALCVVLFAAMLSLPVLWIEIACTARPQVRVPAPSRLVTDPGYARRESDSYLSFPEWHIVYAYDDLAGVLRRGDESHFAYGRQILGFWGSLCGVNHVATSRSAIGLDTKVMLYTIGWSFTAELGIKGLYEKTIGRLFEWLRGPQKTVADAFVARDMQAYAAFLRQTPWYEYPFASRLVAFWRQARLAGRHFPRQLERHVVVTVEYGVKAVYGALIGYASQTALGPADLTIHTVVLGLTPADVTRDRRITVVRDLGSGRTLIRTPRYQAYTDLLVDLARRGRNVAEIAGNGKILVTVLTPKGGLAALPGASQLFEAPIQSTPDRRRIGLDVSVDRLAATIRSLEQAGATIEHIYDY